MFHLTAFEWFSIIQTIVMVVATVLIAGLRKSNKAAVHDHDLTARLAAVEKTVAAIEDENLSVRVNQVEYELERVRKWKHDVIVPWQQTLMDKMEERFLTRREWDQARGDDSPFPTNRRRNPRS